MKHKISPILAIAVLFLFHACSNKIDDVEVNHQGEFAFPLADVSFHIQDLLDNDSIITTNDDNALQIIHREENLVQIKATDLFDDITEQLTAGGYFGKSIGRIFIDDYQKNAVSKFEDAVNEFNDPVIQQFFINNNGQSIPVPSFSEQIDLKIIPDPFDDFSKIDIESGVIQITLTNNYFIDIQDLTLTLYDEISNQDIGSVVFPLIAQGETKMEEIQITNQTLNNEISVIIPTISSPGSSSPTEIDLDSELEITLQTKDFIIVGGDIRLMGTEIIVDSTKVDFEGQNGEEITQIDLENGVMSYSMKSEFSHELKAKIIFPNVLKNGNPLNITMNLPPTGINDSIVGMIDFSGTSMMLNRDIDQPFNRMTVQLETEVVDPTNSIITFNAQDQITFNFSMENLDVEQIFGYFGQFEEQIMAGEIDLDFGFDFLEASSTPIYFDNASIKIESENSFGIPISVDFNIISEGLIDPKQNLNPPIIEISYPEFSMIGETVFGQNFINKDNSDIIDFFSNYTEFINYEGSAFINPNGDEGAINFATKDSKLILHGEFDLPFKFSTQNLVYRDTAEAFSLDLEDGISIDHIREGELKIVYENSMPFETRLDILIQDANGNNQTLIDNLMIESASVNAEGKVENTGIKSGEIFVTLTQAQLRQMDEAVQNLFEIRLQSADNGTVPVAVFTDSGLNLKAGLKVFLQ